MKNPTKRQQVNEESPEINQEEEEPYTPVSYSA